MTRAVIVAFHNYCWMWDHKYFNVMSDYFMKNYREFWKDEIDKLYVIDSTWDFDYPDDKIEVLKVDSNVRYYDAYKKFLPKIKEDMVLFMDNDTLVYRKGTVDETFKKLEDGFDIVSIYDNIGTYKTDKLNGKNKLCPYWFAMSTKLLMRYRYANFAPNMPEYETLGDLTRELLKDGLVPYEWPEDKNSIYIDGRKDGEHGKNTGVYHVRAGSSTAYLLTTKHYGNVDTYWDYLQSQPKGEYMRHACWYQLMGGDPSEVVEDTGVSKEDWDCYYNKFLEFHGL